MLTNHDVARDTPMCMGHLDQTSHSVHFSHVLSKQKVLSRCDILPFAVYLVLQTMLYRHTELEHKNSDGIRTDSKGALACLHTMLGSTNQS